MLVLEYIFKRHLEAFASELFIYLYIYIYIYIYIYCIYIQLFNTFHVYY